MTRFVYVLKEIRACLEAEMLTDVQHRLALLTRDMDNHNGQRVLQQSTFPHRLFRLVDLIAKRIQQNRLLKVVKASCDFEEDRNTAQEPTSRPIPRVGGANIDYLRVLR